MFTQSTRKKILLERKPVNMLYDLGSDLKTRYKFFSIPTTNNPSRYFQIHFLLACLFGLIAVAGVINLSLCLQLFSLTFFSSNNSD